MYELDEISQKILLEIKRKKFVTEQYFDKFIEFPSLIGCERKSYLFSNQLVGYDYQKNIVLSKNGTFAVEQIQKSIKLESRHTKEYVRGWITTAIAFAAFALSIISLLLQLPK